VSWGKIRGHDRQAEALARAYSQGRFPHALLFVGPDGIGKQAFAVALAQALLCERREPVHLVPCGKCPSCLQVEADSHPDVLRVSRPEEKHELPIDAIRKLCHDLSLSPMRGSRRVAIVDDADDLSTEAANAFLKTLEEPPPGAVLILIGTTPELHLDTVLSRCRVVRFEPLPEADVVAILRAEGVVESEAEAERLAARAEGSLTRARGLADADFRAFRDALIEELAGTRGFDPPALTRRLETFSKEAGTESVLVRARASLLIGELARFLRVALWQVDHVAPPGIDPAELTQARNLAARVGPRGLERAIARCVEADYHVHRKAYMPLVLEAFLHDLGAALNPA
jgi:DNA polymerase-3 subunit delta'